MKKPFLAPQSDDFKLARQVCLLTQKNVSEMLHVSLKTVKNWEEGRVAIPYSAFKVLKLLAHYELPQKQWEGWCINQGQLWSPAGRGFHPHELLYIGNYFAMARFWLRDREKIRFHRASLPLVPKLELIQGGLSMTSQEHYTGKLQLEHMP